MKNVGQGHIIHNFHIGTYMQNSLGLAGHVTEFNRFVLSKNMLPLNKNSKRV